MLVYISLLIIILLSIASCFFTFDVVLKLLASPSYEHSRVVQLCASNPGEFPIWWKEWDAKMSPTVIRCLTKTGTCVVDNALWYTPSLQYNNYNIPALWIPRSCTKTVTRYHPMLIVIL